MKLLLAITTAASLALLAPGCKRAEKKEASAPKGTETPPETTPTPAPSSVEGAGKTTPANPHAGMTPKSPHGGAADPHGGMAGAHGGAPSGAAVTATKTGADGTKVLGPFSFKVPEKWIESAPSSSMRVAQFTLNGDGGPAELIVYYFKGGGGSIDANLSRWYGQFKQADGSDSAKKAKRLDREIGGLQVTTTELTGRYVAAMSPANPAGPKHDKADQTLLAAIVQTSAGPFFFKLVGPTKTISAHKGEWDAMVESMKKVK